MRPFRECLSALLRSLKPLWWKVAVSAVAGTADVAASLAFVWASKRIVDIATGSLDLPFTPAVVIFVLIVAAQVLLMVFRNYWTNYITVIAQNNFRQEAYRKAFKSTWTGRERFHSGDTLNRLEEDVRLLTAFLCSSFPDCISTSVRLVAASVYLFVLQPDLAWVLIFIMPVAIVASRLFFRKVRALTNEIRSIDSDIQSHMQETLQHRLVVKTLGGTARIFERLSGLQSEVKSKTVTRLNYNSVSRFFFASGFLGGYAVAFLWGASGLKDGTVTYGMMVAFLQLVGQVQRPVIDLFSHIPAFIKALSSQERLLDICEQPQELETAPVVLDGAPGVRAVNLGFSYENEDKPVFSGQNFDFPPGTMTAIMGHTGAGKSTLIRVVMALLHPSQGSVELYDGTRSVPSSPDTRCNFMYVPQGNSLMTGTIRQNLQLAKADATDEEMKEALSTAVAEFVLTLPGGLDTMCSEVGAGLSEGQAQRIAIARALLRPGGILVLDEATSALDSDTEDELLKRLAARYHGKKTILCITHRSAATAYADRILEMSR